MTLCVRLVHVHTGQVPGNLALVRAQAGSNTIRKVIGEDSHVVRRWGLRLGITRLARLGLRRVSDRAFRFHLRPGPSRLTQRSDLGSLRRLRCLVR
jgi:hypothetical protein